MINKKIADILGVDVPEDIGPQREVVVVEPHEITSVDNPSLPSMADIDRKQLQAEKELQEIINASLQYQKNLFEEAATVEPKYRSRYIEVTNGTMNIALDAIKTKLRTQEEKKKLRLKEAEFSGPTKVADTTSTQNFFFGSREEVREMMKREKEGLEGIEIIDSETDEDT